MLRSAMLYHTQWTRAMAAELVAHLGETHAAAAAAAVKQHHYSPLMTLICLRIRLYT